MIQLVKEEIVLRLIPMCISTTSSGTELEGLPLDIDRSIYNNL